MITTILSFRAKCTDWVLENALQFFWVSSWHVSILQTTRSKSCLILKWYFVYLMCLSVTGSGTIHSSTRFHRDRSFSSLLFIALKQSHPLVSSTAYVIVLFLNLIVALAYLTGGACHNCSNGLAFVLALVFLILHTLSSFCCWYRPVYKAFR